MDKYEYRVKTEQMLAYAEKKAYKKAMEIADTIDWRRVRNASMLCSVSEIYENTGEYQKSRDVLFVAYDRSPGSRKIVYRLGILALKLNDVNEATDCYEEFVQLAPRDPNQFILCYKILRAQKAPINQQIEALVNFKKAEYVEKWAFELAKLYHEAGMAAECLEECDDLILWFSEGKYVYQAMELKMRYKPLTPAQQEKYKHRHDNADSAVNKIAHIRREVRQEAASEEKPSEEFEAVAAEVVVEDAAEEVAEAAVEDTAEETVEAKMEEMAEEPAEIENLAEEITEENAEDIVEEMPEETAKNIVEEINPEAAEEEAATEYAAAPGNTGFVSQKTGTMKIEEILQNWEAQQKEVAKTIEKENEKRKQEQQAKQVKPDTVQILSADIQRLLDELEGKEPEEFEFEEPEETVDADEIVEDIDELLEEPEELEIKNKGDLIETLFVLDDEDEDDFDDEEFELDASYVDEDSFSENDVFIEEEGYEVDEDFLEVEKDDEEEYEDTEADSAETAVEELEEDEILDENYEVEEDFMEEDTFEAEDVVEENDSDDFIENPAPMEDEDFEDEDDFEEEDDYEVDEDFLEEDAYEEEEDFEEEDDYEIDEDFLEEDAYEEAEDFLEEDAYEIDEDFLEEDAYEEEEDFLEEDAYEVDEDFLEEDAYEEEEDFLEEDAYEVEEDFLEEDAYEEAEDFLEEDAYEVDEDFLEEDAYEVDEDFLEEDAYEEEEDFLEEDAYEVAEDFLEEDAYEEAEDFLEEDAYEVAEDFLEEDAYEEAEDFLEEDAYEEAEDFLEEDAYEEEEDFLEEDAYEEAEDFLEEDDYEDEELEYEEPIEEIEEFEDTQSMIKRSPGGVVLDTGFVVQGRYDLEAQSEIGLKAGLTEEQKKLFSYFVPVRGMSEQIVEILEADKRCKRRFGTSRTGNIVITGRKGTGKTVLAVDLVKAIQKDRKIKQGKVAIVTGEALNKKDISNIIDKLHGGALIIERAGRMNSRTVRELNELMEEQTGELLIVLEEQKKPLEKMMNTNVSFRKKFTSKIDLPVFINDELVTFGQTYAKENGYRIDEMGILALYSKIDMLQKEDHAVTVAEVKDVMDAAIAHSQKANVKHLVKRVFGRGTDESDRIILKEDDFK